MLVGVTPQGDDEDDTARHLDELALLVDTAGADAVARVEQRRQAPDPATYLGSGKVAELKELCEAVDADTVVFDDELSPAQQRNLEKLLGRTAIDRTAVILDIFGQNAHSLEGKAQVELAQIRYRLPRLRGKGKSLSQQRGGIGARQGGGETQLEVDRRTPVAAHAQARGRPPDIQRVRQTQGKARQRSRLHRVAIVGYTNAGKSTLLNRLTDAGVLVEDRLFATLDATTRRLQLPGGETVLMTDTVGFITKLPTQLVEAFKSTLEVVVDADLLVHVVDASAPDPEENIVAVDQVLQEIGAGEVPAAARGQQARREPGGGQATPRRPSRFGGHLGPHRRGGRRPAAHHRRPAPRPLDDHRARRPLRPGRRAGLAAPRGRGAGRDRHRRTACGCGPDSTTPRSPGCASSCASSPGSTRCRRHD